jgi:hypothetical protein
MQQNRGYGIKINIFKYIKYLLNLALTCRNWLFISKDTYSRTDCLSVYYRKVYVLYPTFIDISISCQVLIVKKVIILKYFIQRLLMYFKNYNSKMIQLKIEYNVGQLDADRILVFQQKIKLICADDLSISVLTYLLDTEYKQLINVNEELYSKGNYVESVHFLSAVFHVISRDRIQKIEFKI